MTCLICLFLKSKPSSPSLVPQLLLIAVIFFVPLRASAWIKLFGKPAPPKPPNMIVAPSGISATAASRFGQTFWFIGGSPPRTAPQHDSPQAIGRFAFRPQHAAESRADPLRHPH